MQLRDQNFRTSDLMEYLTKGVWVSNLVNIKFDSNLMAHLFELNAGKITAVSEPIPYSIIVNEISEGVNFQSPIYGNELTNYEFGIRERTGNSFRFWKDGAYYPHFARRSIDDFRDKS